MKQKIIFLFFTFFLVTSCQTYTSENQLMRKQLYEDNITGALGTLDHSGMASENRNYSLYRMEKGMLLYLNDQYKPAIDLWLQADKHLDNLYTTSISRTAASLAINDSMSDYQGEAHERILLPLFSSIAFFEQKNLSDSLVMIRRSNDVMNSLNNENEGKNSRKYDTFSHYFSGMVYESKQETDNAIVEYRRALENSQDGKMRQFISKDLGRLASSKNRNDILNQIKKENPNLTWDNQSLLEKNGEVYIIYEAGNSPIKKAEDILVPTDRTIVRISFPVYVQVPYRSHFANIFVDNKYMGQTIVMADIGKMARTALSDRRVKDLAKMTARVVAKDLAARKLQNENQIAGLAANVFNIVTEVADTRSWTTLPDTIQVFRVLVKANQNTEIEIRPEVGISRRFTINLTPGEKRLYRLRTFH